MVVANKNKLKNLRYIGNYRRKLAEKKDTQ